MFTHQFDSQPKHNGTILEKKKILLLMVRILMEVLQEEMAMRTLMQALQEEMEG